MYLDLERHLKCLTTSQFGKTRSLRMKHLYLFQTLSFLHQVRGEVVALRRLRTLPLVYQQQTAVQLVILRVMVSPFHLRHLQKRKKRLITHTALPF